MAEKTMSAAFKAYDEIRKGIYADAPKTADGKSTISVGSLKKAWAKEGEKTLNQTFRIKSKNTDEAVILEISPKGNLVKATYVDPALEGKDAYKFVAKDFDKLSEMTQDKFLVAAAAKISWDKVPEKEEEAEAPEK